MSKQPGLIFDKFLSGHTLFIACLAWSPDGKFLASGAGDNTLRIWRFGEEQGSDVLRGHSEVVSALAWSPDAKRLASGSADRTVRIWDIATGAQLHVLRGHDRFVRTVEWLDDEELISGSEDETIRYWNGHNGTAKRSKPSRNGWVLCLRVSRDGKFFAVGYADGTIRIYSRGGEAHATLTGHTSWVDSLSWTPDSKTLISASGDKSIRVWDLEAKVGRWGRAPRTVLEAHTAGIRSVTVSADGKLLASKADDDSINVWDLSSGAILETVEEKRGHNYWPPSIAFHPNHAVLATLGDSPGVIRVWRVAAASAGPVESVRHVTAKIVLVGDSGVGKTGLGWRLAHGEFKEHASTHGQQFWVLKQLAAQRADGTECEAILWDLAGQPDYRLTHALFLDNADLALILFDPTSLPDPLHGVEFWLRHFRAGPGSSSRCPLILVGARLDRGEPRLTAEELIAFCKSRGIEGGYVGTSAVRDIGLGTLLAHMIELVNWDQKPATATTKAFKEIKDYLLELKESGQKRGVIVEPAALKEQLETRDANASFTNAEIMTAVLHLANYGYIHTLQTSAGEERILLAPELLNNLAASFVNEARRNPKGLGALEEDRLLAGRYEFHELQNLDSRDRETLLDSTAQLFLKRNVCFREADVLSGKSYLVFPDLINLDKPTPEHGETPEDGMSYTVSGAIANLYSSLVVLLGYTPMFTRTDQWRMEARYIFGEGQVCGFRLDAQRTGEVDLVLFFGENVDQPIRTLFQGLFESFLFRRDVNVFRLLPARCDLGHVQNRAIVLEQLREGAHYASVPSAAREYFYQGGTSRFL